VFDGSFYRDPYPAYDKLRSAGPVCKVEGAMGPLPTWLITGYDAAREAFTHPAISKDTRRYEYLLAQGGKRRAPDAAVAASMVATDPPDHTRLRRQVSAAFNAATVEALRPRIQQITDNLLDAIEPAGSADLIASFGAPLPVTVISELLGVPETDRDQLRQWSNANFASGDPKARDDASHQIAGYMTSLVAAKRAHPGEDLLSRLTASDDLTNQELVSLAVLLLIAGHETTTSLIGNAILALLLHPDQLGLLRNDPSLMPAAISEFLRYDSPAAIATIRFTTEPVTIADATIPAEQILLISPAACNRDPAQFPEPERLDLHRNASSHLAFGHGIHYCIGAQLAQAEAEIALSSMLSGFPDLRLATDPDDLQWRRTRLIRSLETLPVRWD
jgi:cytochrome P450